MRADAHAARRSRYCGTHDVRRDGNSSCSTATIPGHVGGRLTRAASSSASTARSADSPAHAMVCLHHHPDRDGQPLARHRRARQPRRFLARSSMRTRTCAPSRGVTCTRSTTASAATCACSRRRRPARSSCPKSDRYAVDSRPPAYRPFELHADGRIDSAGPLGRIAALAPSGRRALIARPMRSIGNASPRKLELRQSRRGTRALALCCS